MTPTPELDYKKYLHLVWKKRYLYVVLALAIMTAVMVTSYLLPEKYEATSTVFIEKSVIGDLVKGIALTPSYEDKIRVLSYAMKSRSLLLKVFDDLDMNVAKQSDSQIESMVKDFQDRTSVSLKDKEGLFIISFHHENPKIARDFVNSLVRRYIEENVSSKREDSYGATRFLSEQITTIKEKLDSAEEKVNNFREKQGSLLAEDETRIFNEIASVQQKIDDINVKRNQLEAMRGMIRRENPLQGRLSALQKKYNELMLTYTDSYPEVQAVKNEMNSVQEQIKLGIGKNDLPANAQQELDRIAVDLKALNQIEQNHRRFIATKRALLSTIPTVKASLEELEREKNTQKTLHDQLVARYGQSEVSKQMEVQDKATTFRIVDPAVIPIKPVSPNRVKIMIMGLVAAIVGSFGILVLLDYTDSSVRNLDTLKTLGVPILAVVPKIENPQQIQETRRKDIRFFAVAGVYFSLLLATFTIEIMRGFSLNLIDPVTIRENLSSVKNRIMK